MKRERDVKFYASKNGSEVISTVLYKGDEPFNLTGQTVEFGMWTSDSAGGTAVQARTSTGVEIQPTQTAVFDSTTGKMRCAQHGLVDNQKIKFTDIGSTTGIDTTKNFYTHDVTGDYFSLSLENDAKNPVTLGGSGNAVFYIVGHVQYTPQGSEYANVGTFYAGFFSETPEELYPMHPDQNDGGMIEVIVQ